MCWIYIRILKNMYTASTTNGWARKFPHYIFLALLSFHIAAISMGRGDWQMYSKPLLIPSLIVYYFLMGAGRQEGRWVLPALVFSWLGDVLLMFQADDDIFFLLGLSSFLLAHIFYIIFFSLVRKGAGVKSRRSLLLLVAAYFAALITFLYPYLGEMRMPVVVYGIVISFMLLLALHVRNIRQRNAGVLMAGGAVLFVLSDSVLAVNKFYQPFVPAPEIIMLTYGLAQLFIVEGAIRYAGEQRKSPGKEIGAVSSSSKIS